MLCPALVDARCQESSTFTSVLTLIEAPDWHSNLVSLSAIAAVPSDDNDVLDNRSCQRSQQLRGAYRASNSL